MFYRKCTVESYSFLVIDTTLKSDNAFHFRRNPLGQVRRVVLTNYDKIRGEELQYNINVIAAKISALLPAKIDKYEYLIGEEILPQQHHRIIEEVKFIHDFSKHWISNCF